MTKYPQVLINVKVKEKVPLEDVTTVKELIEKSEKELGEDGRILVRYSGTENKCRVMVEGKDEILINNIAKKIVDAIQEELGE